ncbi:MAG: HIT domain-containing protein, partial [Comamonas sp.]|nr:HIT domain-containing protein [Comamonas sp.]
MHDPDCLFCKIIAGQIPSSMVYEDEDMLVFKDIHPAAPVHLLMVPKLHIASMAQVGAEQAPLLGRMLA